jgi:ureidoglycolate hydrolase
MDCTTRQLIPGATAQTYVPSDNRLYAVIVSQNGCSDTSSCYAVNTTGIRQNAFTSSLSVYPNPATHQLSINLGQTTAKIRVTITDATGKVTYDHLVNDTQKIDVPTGDFRSGIYVVRIQTGDHTAVRSVVVSN